MWGVVGVLLFLGVGVVLGEDFSLVILHNNDMHARFEETERNSGTCKESHRNVSCIGGFARTAHEIRRYRQMAKEGKIPDVLYLNAGDTYVGTSWFSVFTWNISAEFINALRPDAMSLGNHEFDKGLSVLSPFVNTVTSPILASNLDLSNEPTLKKVKKSHVIDVSGRKVGIIGYLTPQTKAMSAPGDTITFLDEIEAIRNESIELDKEGIDIIIALGHSGYLEDQKIAAEIDLVDLVVGGHTNTFLFNGPQPDLEPIDGPYPTVVTQKSGKTVPVVQAYAFTKYLGVLNVTFNKTGDLTHFQGQPILLDNTIEQEEDILELIEKYRPKIDELDTHIVGNTRTVLDGDANKCRRVECNFGNLATDAFIAYVTSLSPNEMWTSTPIALYNAGRIRNTISPGNITKANLLSALPFGDNLVLMTLNGSDLIKVLEEGARSNGETSRGEFLQVSGLKVVYNATKRPYERVVSVKARCGKCEVPRYEDVDVKGNYSIVVNSFLTHGGGDGHIVLQKHRSNARVLAASDFDAVTWYLGRFSPVYPGIEGRLQFANEENKKSTLCAL